MELAPAGRNPEELAKEFEPTGQTIRNWLQQDDRDIPFLPRIIEFLGCCPYDPAWTPGERLLIWIRKYIGLSQEAMARRLKVDPGMLAMWESGKRTRPSSMRPNQVCRRIRLGASCGAGHGRTVKKVRRQAFLLHNSLPDVLARALVS